MAFKKDAGYWKYRRDAMRGAIRGTIQSIRDAREASNKTHEEAHTSYLNYLLSERFKLRQ